MASVPLLQDSAALLSSLLQLGPGFRLQHPGPPLFMWRQRGRDLGSETVAHGTVHIVQGPPQWASPDTHWPWA